MNRILKLLDDDVRGKSAYSGPLYDLAIETEKELVKAGYDPNAEMYSFALIEETTEKRLKTVTDACASASENPNALFNGAALRYKNEMEKFLDNYKIGFIKDLYINKNGTIVVTLRMSIMPGAFPNAGKRLQEQLEVLSTLGITFVKDSNQPAYIIANDDNKERLYNLLESIGARNIQYTAYEHRINRKIFDTISLQVFDTVSFWMRPSDFDKYCDGKFNFMAKTEEELEDILTDKEVKKLKSNVEKITSMLSNMNTDPDNLPYVGYILESLIYECCKIIGIKPKIYQRYEKRIREEKRRVKRLRAMEDKVGELSKTIDIKEEVRSQARKMDTWILSELPFCLGDVRISPYQTDISVIHDPLLNTEGMSKYEDMELVTISDEVYTVASDDNFTKIEAVLKEKYPNSEVTAYDIHAIQNKRVIWSFSAALK